ncbi:DedA family protein [Saccharopolyspora erythraea]|uniref:DedA family protein n=1 Tax=Saccharopolyspora erythraea TaxID=1836 RepID=UPI001BAAB437|nr:DedA family protein [Saccharopolyspora erythraea]QUH00758.1 DedA family protein [Saccharopolyspora erythraea]
MIFPTQAAAEPAGGLAGWIADVMAALGGPGAGLVVALENLFPPIPSELVLPLAGFAASQGSMNLVGAILWTTLGSLVGAVVLYYLGALLGRDRTRAIAAKLPLVKTGDIDKAEAWFARHGVKAVFAGRMVPIVRSFISLPAGVERMSMPVFLAFTALGSLVWNTALVLAGYLLGRSWWIVEGYVGVFQKVVIVAAVVAVVWFVAARLRRGRRVRT